MPADGVERQLLGVALLGDGAVPAAVPEDRHVEVVDGGPGPRVDRHLLVDGQQDHDRRHQIAARGRRPPRAGREGARHRAPARWHPSSVVVDDAAGLHRGIHGRRARRRRTRPASAPWPGPPTPATVAGTLAVRGSLVPPRGERPEEGVEPAGVAQPSTARAFVIAASTLSRLRTMPVSAISRARSASSKRATCVGVEAREGRTEGGPLAQDRQPRQPGLERLEGEPLVDGALAADRHPPLGVVVGEVVRGAAGPGTAGEPVLPQHHPGHEGVRALRRTASPSMPSRARANIRPLTRSVTGRASLPQGRRPRGDLLHPLHRRSSRRRVDAHVCPAVEDPAGLDDREAAGAALVPGGSHRVRIIESLKCSGPIPLRPGEAPADPRGALIDAHRGERDPRAVAGEVGEHSPDRCRAGGAGADKVEGSHRQPRDSPARDSVGCSAASSTDSSAGGSAASSAGGSATSAARGSGVAAAG